LKLLIKFINLLLKYNLLKRFTLFCCSLLSLLIAACKTLWNKRSITIDNIALLKTVNNAAPNQKTKVLGYYSSTDQGGGVFYWDSESTRLENEGVVVKTDLDKGRWIRIIDVHEINIKYFGASENAEDNLAKIQKAIDFSKVSNIHTIKIPLGRFKVNGTLNLQNGIELIGIGKESQLIQTCFAKNILNAHDVENVKIQNLSLVGTNNPTLLKPHSDTGDFQNENGIHILRSKSMIISNCFISGFVANGIYAAYSKELLIKDNLFFGNHYIIGSGCDVLFYNYVDNSKILNNKCYSNNSQGIGAGINGVCNNIEIAYNTCIPKDPITFENLPYDKIIRRTGIICGYAVPKYGESYYNIHDNYLFNVGSTGIYVCYSKADIINNHIENVGFGTLNGSGIRAGIKLTDCQQTTIQGGTIKNYFVTGAITDIDAAIAIQGSDKIKYCDNPKTTIKISNLLVDGSVGAGISMYYLSTTVNFDKVTIRNAQNRDLYFDFTGASSVEKHIDITNCKFYTSNLAAYYSSNEASNTNIRFIDCIFIKQGLKQNNALYFLFRGQDKEIFQVSGCHFENFNCGIGVHLVSSYKRPEMNISENCRFKNVNTAFSLVSNRQDIKIKTKGTKLENSGYQNATHQFIKEKNEKE
jgi:Right handed beta helix region